MSAAISSLTKGSSGFLFAFVQLDLFGLRIRPSGYDQHMPITLGITDQTSDEFAIDADIHN